MDLSRWSEDDYYVPLARRILLRLGAHPYRCEYCRVNFVSFRSRRERYRSRRQRRAEEQTATAAPKSNATAAGK